MTRCDHKNREAVNGVVPHRLTPVLEREARELSAIALEHTVYAEHVRPLLNEITALRAELDGAEERGAAREREACANWLTLGEPADEKLGAAVRRGDHVLWWESTGTTPPDAGESQ